MSASLQLVAFANTHTHTRSLSHTHASFEIKKEWVSIELGRNRRQSVNTIKLVFQIGYFIERKSLDQTILFDVDCWFIIMKSSTVLYICLSSCLPVSLCGEYIYISTSTADKINYFGQEKEREREHVMGASSNCLALCLSLCSVPISSALNCHKKSLSAAITCVYC